MLVGRAATRLSTQFLTQDKEYLATLRLGEQTDTYDCTGHIQATSPLIPSPLQVEEALVHFQGRIEQIPPMFCAKSVQGKRLYTLARQGIEIERQPIQVELSTQLLSYAYPHLQLHVRCSKGTYIRSLADALGKRLGCGAHLSELIRTRSGPFLLEDCIPATAIDDPHLTLHPLPPP